MKPVLGKIALAVLTLYGLATASLYITMLQGPGTFANTMKHLPWQTMMVLPFKPLWMSARAGHVAIGEAAPDFSLRTSDETSTFRLSSMRGVRPVVLVFGSYT